ncbi:MAG: hypothetical protein OXC18_19960 [Desulfurellaceae bacterium]|nr:hypothetical protein [Desulfurellaceae bacterium]
MSVELIGVLIAVVAVGATLAGLMLSGQRVIRAELAEQRRELVAQRRDFSAELAAQRQYFDERFTALEQRFTALEQQVAELRERMAHLEGLLDGLREAIAIRQGAA